MVIADGVGQVAPSRFSSTRSSGATLGMYVVSRSAGAGELADPVDRVVVVEREQEPVAPVERVRLADQP